MRRRKGSVWSLPSSVVFISVCGVLAICAVLFWFVVSFSFGCGFGFGFGCGFGLVSSRCENREVNTPKMYPSCSFCRDGTIVYPQHAYTATVMSLYTTQCISRGSSARSFFFFFHFSCFVFVFVFVCFTYICMCMEAVDGAFVETAKCARFLHTCMSMCAMAVEKRRYCSLGF